MNETEKKNKQVVAAIFAVVMFPLVVSVFAFYNASWSGEAKDKVFDTLQVPGYSFYKSMGILVDETSDVDLYNSVYPLLGVPHRSRAGGRGLDCSGLVRKVYAETWGIEVRGSSRDIFRGSKPLPLEQVTEGDILFFKIGGSVINHAGIYLQNGFFVHTSTSAGVKIDHLEDDYYRKSFYKAGRLMD